MAPPSTPEGPPSEPPESSEAAPKVLYVMGAGRSGSTILGVALGNCKNVFFAGELNKWLPRSGTSSLDDPERERFWRAIRARVRDAEGLFGHQASCLERSSVLFEPRRWPARRRLRSSYLRIAEELYRAIAQETGASQIVDTSHYPLRARELQAIGGIELYLLYLVRDPRSVIASLSRTDVRERSFGTLTANAYLWLTGVLALSVFLRHPRERRVFLRHEDFRADPQGVLRQVLDRMGSRAATPDMTALRTGVPLHGNRLISAEVVTLKAQEVEPIGGLRVTRLLQLPLTIVLSRLRPAVRARAASLVSHSGAAD